MRSHSAHPNSTNGIRHPFIPQFPLTAAESFVRWEAHRDHIVNQRARVERLALPTVRRLALAVSDFNLPLNLLQRKLEDQLLLGLERSVRFGYREAQREIRAQRGQPSGRRSLPASSSIRLDVKASRSSLGEARGSGDGSLHLRPGTSLGEHEPGELPSPLRTPLVEEAFALETAARTLSARYAIPDVGRYADSARHGLPGIYALIRHRSGQVVRNVSDAAKTATWTTAGDEKVAASLAVATAATKALHNSVLELVGEALNLGRTAGAFSMRPVPEFALRSAQLDNNSCGECEREHGEIYPVESNEYFAHLPPAYCLGAGRCRCLYVFEDGPGLAP